MINDENPPDDILEGLYKLRIRESEQLKTVLELYDLDIHQKKIGPDYHRLKTMVKRSIEQNIRNRNLGPEMEIMKETPWSNPGTKQRGQRILGDCWQWESNGQCSRGDNCSFRHDINKRAKSYTSQIRLRILSCSRMREMRREPEVPEEEVPVVECLDGLARITSKELAPIHFVKSGTLQNAGSTRPRVVADFGKSALMRIARFMNSLVKGPKRMMTKVQWPY